MSTLSERLAEAMHRRPGSKQADLKRITGAKSSSVSNWFGGRTKTIEITHAQLLAAHFGCDPIWLATGQGTPNWGSTTPQATNPAPPPPTLAQALTVLGAELAQELPHDVREDLADALAKLARRGGTDRDQRQIIQLLQDAAATPSKKGCINSSGAKIYAWPKINPGK